ncbi:hypothetical protein JOF53_002827 [Crossiella equi]|uniref:Uncharacterized protein n=1 Tax=Crossiella equi TaxID=130796 RepID=A0ABS5ABK3_9PSEU|nr:hypothetical protein [Crossiella equi]MBP2473955.1 hypothetical protein [Crossiella equi]
MTAPHDEHTAEPHLTADLRSPIRNEMELPARRLLGSRPAPTPRPHTTFVLSSADGEVYVPAKLPGAREWRASGARWLYEVDLADHWALTSVGLPCHGDLFQFHTELEFGWRVHDPVQVVRSRVTDAVELCRRHLLAQLRQESRRFDPSATALAETALNQLAGTAPATLPEGVTLFRCHVRITQDERLREHRLAMLAEAQQGELILTRAQRLRKMVEDGTYAVLALHLAEHPGDTAKVVQLLAEQEKMSLDTSRGIVQSLLDSGFAQDVDIDQLGGEALRRVLSHLQAGPGRALREFAANRAQLPENPDYPGGTRFPPPDPRNGQPSL